ncbi:hypothetical protein ISF_01768 [Cordyceps fumosorosea ARSEF 2679]|uniref:Uncharacterized protein n=1 Tax=Cordyceps fumosorosea (strain ARSEF 2679) TaxID=1081104 RepID=A0A168CCC6_CORFA|nr:hypothetical protein ISF_01768 [Cordyceps fumosorosea ARSEF 2679]OAA71217.1 hypothetical protein ISF_01768 [Cordyceps fumosorosea ARSEF 2679]
MPQRFNYHVLSDFIHRDDLLIGHIITGTQDMSIINPGEILDYDKNRTRAFNYDDATLDEKEASSCNASFLTDVVSGVINGRFQMEKSKGFSKNFAIPQLCGQRVEFLREDYLKAVDCSPAVQKHLDTFGGRVYMVTAVLLCDEFSVTIRQDTMAKGRGGVAVDCGPARIGAGMQGAGGGGSGQQATVKGDHVFAVKLTKLRYTKKFNILGEKQLEAKKYTHRAALVGKSKSKSNARNDPDKDYTFEVDIESESEEAGVGEEYTGGGHVVSWIVPMTLL